MSSNGTLTHDSPTFRAETLRGMSLPDRVRCLDRCLTETEASDPPPLRLFPLAKAGEDPCEEQAVASVSSEHELPPLRDRLYDLWLTDSKSGEIGLFVLSCGWSMVLCVNPALFEGTRGHYDGVAQVAAEWFWGVLLGAGALSILLGLILRRNAARHAGVLLCGAVWGGAAVAQFSGSPTFSPTPTLMALLATWVYLRLPSNGTF